MQLSTNKIAFFYDFKRHFCLSHRKTWRQNEGLQKKKILLRVIHESLCLSVHIKQIFWLLIIRKMLRKTYILHNSTTFMFIGALWICEEKFNLEILLLWKIEMHLLWMELFVDNCKNTQCLEIFLVRLYQFFTVLKFLSNTI